MLCQVCKKNPATIHVTEVSYASGGEADASPEVEQRDLCQRCAAKLKLPYTPVLSKTGLAVFEMLKESARRARESGGLACPDCGMTLAEFRSKGRLGCPRDYEVFQVHLKPLLLRVHNATQHRGRLPGVDEGERERIQHISDLRTRLEQAIKAEAYESAAQIRDELQELETRAARGS